MKSQSARAGASVPEFAIVAMVFFVFVLGFIEIGRGFMVLSLLQNAARAGCRAGILSSASNTNITSAVDAALNNQGINNYSTTVKVNGNVVNASTAQSNDQIMVTVQVPASSVSWVPGAGLLKNNLRGQYTLYRE